MPKTTGSKAVNAAYYTDSQYIVETVYQNSVPTYAILNGQGLTIANKFTVGGVTMKPYDDPMGTLRAKAVLLPSNPSPYKSKRELLERIEQYIYDYCDMPPFWQKLCAHYALMTWVFDLFGAVPYLRFLGDFETGKTRMWETVSQCSCRTILIGSGSTVSPMFRMIEKYKGTLAIDEADFRASDLDSQIIKVLNAGYRRGGMVWRSEELDGVYHEKPFDVFSPKIITNRRRFQDDATESRCITYIVPSNRRVRSNIPVQLLPNIKDGFAEQGQEIRNMCLQWRFDNYRSITPDLNVSPDMPNRFREISVPIITLIEDQQFKDEFISMLSSEGKVSRQESLMALCIQAVHALAGAQATGKVKAGEVAEEMVRLASDEQDEIEMSGKAAGDLLRQLKFQPAPRTGRGCFYFFTRQEISDLMKQYDL